MVAFFHCIGHTAFFRPEQPAIFDLRVVSQRKENDDLRLDIQSNSARQDEELLRTNAVSRLLREIVVGGSKP